MWLCLSHFQAKARVAAKQQQVVTAQDQVTQLQQELVATRQRITAQAKLKVKQVSCWNVHGSHTTHNAHCAHMPEHVCGRVPKALDKAAEVQTSLDAANTELEAARARESKLQADIQALQEEREAAGQNNGDDEDAPPSNAAQLRDKELQELQAALAAREQQVGALRAQLHESDSKLTVATERLRGSRSEVDRVTEQTIALQEELEATMEELTALKESASEVAADDAPVDANAGRGGGGLEVAYDNATRGDQEPPPASPSPSVVRTAALESRHVLCSRVVGSSRVLGMWWHDQHQWWLLVLWCMCGVRVCDATQTCRVHRCAGGRGCGACGAEPTCERA